MKWVRLGGGGRLMVISSAWCANGVPKRAWACLVDVSHALRLTENEHRQAWLQRQDDGPSVSQQGPAPAPRAAGEREGRLAGGGGDGAEGKYLIATSEQALCALHQDGVFEPQQLPARCARFAPRRADDLVATAKNLRLLGP